MKRCVSFFSGILVMIIALMSPLDALTDVLFSAHMVQHLILILVAAPPLVMSDFPVAFLWALPRSSSQSFGYRWNQSKTLSRLWKLLNNPLFAWSTFSIAIWLWHAPKFFDAALQHEAIHITEHLVFLITAMLFWWILLKPTSLRHLRYGMAVLYLFTTILQSGILGALMTFSSRPWYPYYAAQNMPWGLNPLQDQQIAGLIMWMPGGFVFTLLTIGYFAAWLRALDQRSTRSPRDSFQAPQELNH
jgi:putative membrane protein